MLIIHNLITNKSFIKVSFKWFLTKTYSISIGWKFLKVLLPIHKKMWHFKKQKTWISCFSGENLTMVYTNCFEAVYFINSLNISLYWWNTLYLIHQLNFLFDFTNVINVYQHIHLYTKHSITLALFMLTKFQYLIPRQYSENMNK